MSTTEKPLRRLPLRRSLLRPILLAGGERALVLINCTLIAALIFGVGITTFTVTTAILLATLGQWCLVQAAKADPDMTQVYRRHILYKEFYPAQSSVHARAQIIHPSIPN